MNQQKPQTTLDTKYKTQLQTYTQKLKTSKNSQQIIIQLIKSQQIQHWKVLSVVINMLQENDTRNKKIVQEIIQRNLDYIQNFMCFMFAFNIKVTRKLYYYGSLKWRRLYNDLCIDKALISIFQTWVQSDPNSNIVQQSLQLVSQTFPIFLKDQYITLTEIQLNSIIGWVSYLHTPNSQKYQHLLKLVKVVKQNRTILAQDYVEKQHLIIKKLIDICNKNSGNSANMFLFIYPSQLKQKDISYFCHVYSDYLLQITQQNLYNFFTCITKSAITLQIIYLINKISLLLKNSQQYYKLKTIYEKYILPILVRRMKTCKKYENQIFQLCQFYTLGFLRHCEIGVHAMQCIVRNVSKITNNKAHDNWVKLIQIICYHNSKIKQQAEKLLSIQYKKDITLLMEISHEKIKSQYQRIINNKDIVWEVTIRNSRKLKQYKKTPSKIKGIKNQQNECYIITVVQALQKGKLLQNLFSQYMIYFKQKKCQLLNQLNLLFQQVSGKRTAKQIVVRYLKRKGPSEFRQSQSQQDAYHYLVQLFEALQKQVKLIPSFLQQFKKVYQIKCLSVNVCNKCHTKKQIQQRSYTLSIPHTDILRQQTSETISDFNCENCKQLTQAVLTRKLEPQSQILIIQINRFSHQKGVAKKQLSTQTILRYFMHYTLVGMICHRGKNIQHGHYVYYHRINEKKWVLLNDSNAQQFQLNQEDQQFQRQWKSEMTPFILFYQKLDQ